MRQSDADIEASKRASQRSRYGNGKFAPEQPAATAPLEGGDSEPAALPAKRMKLRSGAQGARITGNSASGLTKGQVVRLQFSNKAGTEEGEYKVIWSDGTAALAAPYERPVEIAPPDTLWEDTIIGANGVEVLIEVLDDPEAPLYMAMTEKGGTWEGKDIRAGAKFRDEVAGGAEALEGLLQGGSRATLISTSHRRGGDSYEKRITASAVGEDEYSLHMRDKDAWRTSKVGTLITRGDAERLLEGFRRAELVRDAERLLEGSQAPATPSPPGSIASSSTTPGGGRAITLQGGDSLRFQPEAEGSLGLSVTTTDKQDSGFEFDEARLREASKDLELMRAGQAATLQATLYSYARSTNDGPTRLLLTMMEIDEDRYALSYHRRHRREDSGFFIALDRDAFEAIADEFKRASDPLGS